jgi:hypothetical protein
MEINNGVYKIVFSTNFYLSEIPDKNKFLFINFKNIKLKELNFLIINILNFKIEDTQDIREK